MPSRDVNAATRLAEASWRRDKKTKPNSKVIFMFQRVLNTCVKYHHCMSEGNGVIVRRQYKV